MNSFHAGTFELLGTEPHVSRWSVSEVEQAEQRLGFRLPASVREWYCYADAVEILAQHSNQDPPIPLSDFVISRWRSQQLLPFRIENQGICVWAIMLDGSVDPPVYVDVDSDGTEWQMLAPTFSAYVRACIWDFEVVFGQPGLAQAQNAPVSAGAIAELRRIFTEEPKTLGWPGSTQYRFAGKNHAILIWAANDQADWFVGATDETSLEAALRMIWSLDDIGKSF